MVDYVESPFERLISIQLSKKRDDDGGGDPDLPPTHPICVPDYVHPIVAWFIYIDTRATYLLPHSCCPPSYFVGEDDYAQHTVWSEEATKVTLTVDIPNDYMSHNLDLTLAAWIRPQQNPLHFLDPLLWYSLQEPGVVVTFGPAGLPSQDAGHDSSLTVTIPLPPHALTPAQVPGSPPADPDKQLIGTTMVQFAIWSKFFYDLGIFRNAFRAFPDGSTLTVQHDCKPNSIPKPPPGEIFPRRRRTR